MKYRKNEKGETVGWFFHHYYFYGSFCRWLLLDIILFRQNVKISCC